MKLINIKETVFGTDCVLLLQTFDDNDAKKWKALFDKWITLSTSMKDFKSRGINFPEGLSEVAFCLYSGSKKLVSLNGKASSSFDTFNTSTHKAEQIKATSIKNDLTSFGPTSKWDDLYFLDFYNEGKLDGTFNVFKIPNKFINEHIVNKSQSFIDQQKEKRRPRFSVKYEIIIPENIKALTENVKVW